MENEKIAAQPIQVDMSQFAELVKDTVPSNPLTSYFTGTILESAVEELQQHGLAGQN